MVLLILSLISVFRNSDVYAPLRNGPNNQPTLPRTPAGLGNGLNSLLDSASIFMAKALAPSTLKAYSYAWSMFNLFCISMHVSALPVSVPIVCAFIVHCSESRRHKLSTIRGNLAGIQLYARCQDSGSPSIFSTPTIRLLLKGMYKSCQKY